MQFEGVRAQFNGIHGAIQDASTGGWCADEVRQHAIVDGGLCGLVGRELINPDYYCQSPEVTVTAREARDELVGTYDKNMGAFLAPGGVIAYGDNLEVTEMPAKIEITPARCYWKKVPMSSVRQLDFRPQKVRLFQTSLDWNVQGEITNPFDEDIEFLKGAVLFRDKSGKLLGGDLIFIRNLPAKGTKPFMERLYFKGAMPDKFDQFDFLVFPSSFDWEKIVR